MDTLFRLNEHELSSLGTMPASNADRGPPCYLRRKNGENTRRKPRRTTDIASEIPKLGVTGRAARSRGA
jgi:hypothetical protein